jgi:hypothetical protein
LIPLDTSFGGPIFFAIQLWFKSSFTLSSHGFVFQI